MFAFVFQALCGTTLYIPMLGSNEPYPLVVNDIINPSTVKVIKNRGLPLPKQPHLRGDLLVEFGIRFPSKLSSVEKELLSSVLPEL